MKTKEEVNFKEEISCCFNCKYCNFDYCDDCEGTCSIINRFVNFDSHCSEYMKEYLNI